MSIRTRLAGWATLVLAITIAVLGFVMVGTARTTLTAQLDKQLKDFAGKGSEYSEDRRNWRTGGNEEPDPVNYHLYAEGIVSPDGEVTWKTRSGFAADPESPPALPEISSDAWEEGVNDVVTRTAVDGSRRYRVYVKSIQGGSFYVAAASLASIDATVARLQRWVLFAGGAALVVSALTTWWLIRRGLRPVDRMVDTAAAIAAGDLGRRVPLRERTSELGRLGVALNEMLGQIEGGIRQRAASEERLRRFVADAAHELRTPLTALRGYTELYRQGALTTREAMDNAMQRIEAESARLTRLVEDMLLLARLDNERGLEMEPTDVVDIVRDAITDFQAVERDRPLSADLVEAAPVIGDRVRLRQVVDNLLVNTRLHTPPGTPVHVAVRREDGHVDIVVADEGPGISQADQERVFERFWRADPSRVRRTGGTGLGLAIVSSLVQAHGGEIELASVPGRGARFTVRLPLAQPSSPAA